MKLLVIIMIIVIKKKKIFFRKKKQKAYQQSRTLAITYKNKISCTCTSLDVNISDISKSFK